MQVFAYKMCNFLKKVFQYPPFFVGDFCAFSCIYAKKVVSLQPEIENEHKILKNNNQINNQINSIY